MTDWKPEIESLEQLRHIFKASLSSDKFTRQQANEALEEARRQPDLDRYLLFMLVEDDASVSNIRASAGLLLKNNIMNTEFTQTKSKEIQLTILNNILKGLLVEDSLVRNITGNVITALFQIYGIENWPQILIQLLEFTNGEKGNSIKSQEGAISALAKICEDSAMSLDKEFNGQIPSEFLIPNFLNLLEHDSPIVKAKAIGCLNQFIGFKSPHMEQNFEKFLSSLFVLTNNSNEDVRKNVCTSFYLILGKYPECLAPHIEGITLFCLHTIVESTKLEDNSHEEVALEACEFLLGLATSSSIDFNLIKGMLPNMVPILLEKMVYSKSDIELYEQMDSIDDDDLEDKDEDIKPTNARNKEKVASKINNYKALRSEVNNSTEDNEDSEEEDGEEDDEEDEEDDISVWNLRKCSAATLDVLAAKVAPLEIINLVFPLLESKIISDQWAIREAGILAIGAISNACLEMKTDKIPFLIKFLIERTKDSSSRVRQITCWTLGRFSPWVCNEAETHSQYSEFYLPTLQAIMDAALDNKKIVQQSASYSLDSFISNSSYELTVGLVEPLLNHFNKCFLKYKRKNMVILYDALQTFIDKVGDILTSKEEYITLLLPPLLEKWETLDDNDKDLWPLLECMSSVAASLGEMFAPYAVPAYQRSIRILQNCINLDKMCHVDPTINTPEKDFMVTAIDLIDGLVQGLGSHSAELIKNNNSSSSSSNTNLVDLLLTCFQDPIEDVRQSAFALLGDLAIFVMRPVVLPYLHPIMQCIINEIDNRTTLTGSVCNNAAWTLGEISLVTTREELLPYLPTIINSLISLLNDTDYEPTAIENAAIALGRLGTYCPNDLSPHLSNFIINWCFYSVYLESNEEKESSFKGMCNIIFSNPQSVGNDENLKLVLNCLARYNHPSLELQQGFEKLINGYRELIGDNWNNVINSLDMEVQVVLRTRFGA